MNETTHETTRLVWITGRGFGLRKNTPVKVETEEDGYAVCTSPTDLDRGRFRVPTSALRKQAA